MKYRKSFSKFMTELWDPRHLPRQSLKTPEGYKGNEKETKREKGKWDISEYEMYVSGRLANRKRGLCLYSIQICFVNPTTTWQKVLYKSSFILISYLQKPPKNLPRYNGNDKSRQQHNGLLAHPCRCWYELIQ